VTRASAFLAKSYEEEMIAMIQKEEAADDANANDTHEKQVPLELHEILRKHYLITKKVTDHLANERTFLAWTRTALSIIAFGFVVERFGLLLRELGVKVNSGSVANIHYSTIIGITLTLLGTLVMVVALINFLQVRNSIDKDRFHPHRAFAILLTVITCLIGVILAVYLYQAA
jgi:putative membrane protein